VDFLCNSNGLTLYFFYRWYDRIETINPFDQAFSGKLIGVADYGFATDDHTLVVQVINPGCGADNLFISYNRKKGMNIDTGELGDKITVTQARFTVESRYLGAADEDSIFEIEDFFNGRKLIVTVDNKGTESGDGGEVDYASVRIELEIEDCTTASDCSEGTNSCVSATCSSSNKCVYNAVANCCGNGICELEAGESCGSCDCDCKKPTHCNDVGYEDIPKKCPRFMRVGGTWAPAGHMFDITAKKDVTIYAFEIIYSPYLNFGPTIADFIRPEVYAKKDTWVGNQHTPETWEEHRGPTPLPVILPNATGCLPPSRVDVVLDRPIYIHAGETAGIYLTLQQPSQLWLRPASNYVKRRWDSVGDVFVQNPDIQLKAGVATEYKFGLYLDFISWPAYFVGRPKYMYGSKCYSDGQCDDNNVHTTDTCSSSSMEWYVVTHENLNTQCAFPLLLRWSNS